MPGASPNWPRRNLFGALSAAILFCLLSILGGAPAFARPLGTDVSGYQTSINWTAVKNAGVTFAWAKATEGTYYTNPYFTAQETGAKGVGIYIGAYHYARPSLDTNITGLHSADTEAAFFWSVASNYVKGTGTYMVPMLDWEDIHATNGYNGFRGFTTAFMSAWVNEWCNSVSNLARANGVTLKPIVYTGTWYSVPNGVYPGLNTSVTTWPAWIATYNGEDAQSGSPSSSYPWSTWAIWQYADTNWSGGDSDVFNGTPQGLTALVVGGVAAPTITTQPIWRAVDAGGSVTLAATASGNAPLAYQWTFGGTKIAGATNTTYTLTNAQTASTGSYALVVTNASGSITSSPSWLVVYPVQAVAYADDFNTNSATHWTINKSSSDTAVAFAFDYSTLGIPPAPHTLDGTTRGLQLKANLTAGAVAAISLTPTGQSFTGDYRLHFDAWINVNGPFPDGGASSTEFLTAGVGTAGTSVEWTGGAGADGYYFSADGDGGVSGSSTTSGDYSGYVGATWQGPGTGAYPANSTDNGAVYYQTAFPTGAAAPALQQSKYAQQTGNLSSGTLGLGWHDFIVARRGSSVDWVVDGIRLATVSGATVSGHNVSVGFWDPFASLTDNTNLSFGLVDNLRVEVPAVAPAFTLNPVTQTVPLGTNVLFTAAASGLPGPAYQWRFNGANIPGATNASYAIAFVTLTNAGTYSAVATNVTGSATSAGAQLSITAPAPAAFEAITVPDGSVQISFSGDPYWTYTVEMSTNLVDWTTLTNLTSTNGAFIFNAGPDTNAPQEFFRARVGP